MLDLTFGVVSYCVLAGLIFLGLWLWYDRRDHASFDVECRKTTFHCIRCGHLYAEKQGTELALCPKCAHQNVRLKF